MIGWRGASRYYDSDYREGFALECAAMKNVREVMGFEVLLLESASLTLLTRRM